MQGEPDMEFILLQLLGAGALVVCHFAVIVWNQVQRSLSKE
jgi:hypothetical protein